MDGHSTVARIVAIGIDVLGSVCGTSGETFDSLVGSVVAVHTVLEYEGCCCCFVVGLVA